jgi:hypothetical protein
MDRRGARTGGTILVGRPAAFRPGIVAPGSNPIGARQSRFWDEYTLSTSPAIEPIGVRVGQLPDVQERHREIQSQPKGFAGLEEDALRKRTRERLH